MFGSFHSMTPLETRKRLLVAESDLLRVQLSEDGERLKSAWDRSGVRALGGLRQTRVVGWSVPSGCQSCLHLVAELETRSRRFLLTHGAAFFWSILNLFLLPKKSPYHEN